VGHIVPASFWISIITGRFVWTELVLCLERRIGLVSSHLTEVVDLLSRSMHERRRGFRTIGEFTCQYRIAANTSLKWIGEPVHCFERRRGLVSSHRTEVDDLLSRSMHEHPQTGTLRSVPILLYWDRIHSSIAPKLLSKLENNG